MVGLVSYPSSGNTWLRYLIEGLTGFFSGSMYNDFLIGKKGRARHIGDKRKTFRRLMRKVNL
jgi:hypothetical protein